VKTLGRFAVGGEEGGRTNTFIDLTERLILRSILHLQEKGVSGAFSGEKAVSIYARMAMT